MMAEGLTKVQMSQIPLLHGTNVYFFGKHFLDICALIRLAVNSAVLAILKLSRVCANLGRVELG
jgi:hypothetical protein